MSAATEQQDQRPGTFLERDEIKALTGRSYVKLQIEALKNMGIPFFVNAIGRPVVTRSAIEGRGNAATQQKKAWQPRVLTTG
ncbi:DUF4224 domain-containing protein [Massilia sp. TN1-12]|uniref:DUF4224 domain-containing protein n=1 Tax=Massilia paldalensis TaxID=3377675 RepID=UPI00384DB19D